MAVNVKKGFGVGIDSLWYGLRGANGWLSGSMAKLDGIKTFPLGLQEAERVNVTGDNGAIGSRLFSPIELPNGSPTFAVFDMTFAAMAMGLQVEDLAGGSFLGLQPDELQFQDLILMTVTVGTSQAAGSSGSTVYTGKILPAVQCFYQDDAGMTERAPTDYVFSMTAQKVDRPLWGTPFTVDDWGSTKFAAYRYTWPYMPHAISFTVATTEQTFDLPYRFAEAAASNFIVTLNGDPLTFDAVSAGVGEFAVTAGTRGDDEDPDILTVGDTTEADDVVTVFYGRL